MVRGEKKKVLLKTFKIEDTNSPSFRHFPSVHSMNERWLFSSVELHCRGSTVLGHTRSHTTFQDRPSAHHANPQDLHVVICKMAIMLPSLAGLSQKLYEVQYMAHGRIFQTNLGSVVSLSVCYT